MNESVNEEKRANLHFHCIWKEYNKWIKSAIYGHDTPNEEETPYVDIILQLMHIHIATQQMSLHIYIYIRQTCIRNVWKWYNKSIAYVMYGINTLDIYMYYSEWTQVIYGYHPTLYNDSTAEMNIDDIWRWYNTWVYTWK